MMSSDSRAAEASFDFRQANRGRDEGKSLVWRLRQPIVPFAKDLIRRFGMVTASRRTLPSYLIIGAKRGGSTTLARNLVASPGVSGLFPHAEDLKGTYYFDVNHAKGARWYRSHFPTSSALGTDIVGEASPYYLSHPLAAQRAAALVPDARIVVVLRHPVERAFSHYRERVKQGIETLPTFEAALAAEPERTDGEVDAMVTNPAYTSWNHLNFAYRDQSRYGRSLGRWFEHFDRDAILVLRSEDMYADPPAALATVRGFLGLADHSEPAASLDHHNRLPAADIEPATRAQLTAELADDVDHLERLVDRPMHWFP